MKAWAKYVLFGVGGVIAAAGAFYAWCHVNVEMRRAERLPVRAETVAAPSDAAAVAEGARLVTVKGCRDCHGSDMGGRVVIDEAPIGRIAGSNLTGGRGGVVGSFTDADWARAIRQGVAASGRPLVLMPSNEFHGVSDEDLGRMIAYLKQVPPVDRETPPIVIGPMARVLHTMGAMPILFSAYLVNHDAAPAASQTPAPTAAYGAYLASACVGCHGEAYTGGPIPGMPPHWPAAANLTPGGRVGQWTLAQFKAALTEGLTPEGRRFDPQFMPWKSFALFNDVEVQALFAFFRSLPAGGKEAR